MVVETRKKKAATVAAEVLAAPTEEVAQINISKIALREATIPILGMTPLIVHRFSEKAKRQMLDAQQGKRTPKQPRNPDEEYEAALYRLPDGGFGFPCAAFRQATIGAARFYGKDVSMTALKQYLFVQGEMGVDGEMLVRIEGEPVLREDVVRLGRGSSDLRYRPIFNQWRCSLRMIFVTSALTNDSVLSLVDAGGLGVGVGEWRPERDGDFGRFQIDQDRVVAFREVQ